MRKTLTLILILYFISSVAQSQESSIINPQNAASATQQLHSQEILKKQQNVEGIKKSDSLKPTENIQSTKSSSLNSEQEQLHKKQASASSETNNEIHIESHEQSLKQKIFGTATGIISQNADEKQLQSNKSTHNENLKSSQLNTNAIEQKKAVSPEIMDPLPAHENIQHNQEIPIPSKQQDLSEQQKALRDQSIRVAHQAELKNNADAQLTMSEQETLKLKQRGEAALKQAKEVYQRMKKQRQAKQALEQQEIKKLQVDHSIARADKVRNEERENFNKNVVKLEKGIQTKFTEYLFQIDQTVEEFIISTPMEQQIAFYMYSYVTDENTYTKISSIDNEPPIRVYVYENNNRIVERAEFYFQSYIIFKGLKDNTYTIRFFNSGATKLISLNMKIFTEATHISDVLTAEEMQFKGVRANRAKNQIENILVGFRRYWMLDMQNMRKVAYGLHLYFSYGIAETIVAILVCFLQVTVVKKLLKVNTIV